MMTMANDVRDILFEIEEFFSVNYFHFLRLNDIDGYIMIIFKGEKFIE